MVSADQLLDPSAHDPELRAFAYIQARFVKGARSAVECLYPFVLFAVGSFHGELYDREVIIKFLKEKYRMSLPRYMLEEIESYLLDNGALIKHDIGGVFTCHRVQNDQVMENKDIDFSFEQIRTAETALDNFAKDKGFETPFDARTWGEALVSFFQSDNYEEERKTGKIGATLVSDIGYFDRQVVSEFILDASIKYKDIYRTIEKVFYGVLVSEFLTRIETSGNKSEYSGLNIIYDNTVLLRLLGTSGRYLKTATIEMHEVLQDLGCRTFYFNHTYSEMISSLEYVLNASERGYPIAAETQAALEGGEIKISDISTLLASPDVPLGILGITEFNKSYEDRLEDDYQIDEEEFINVLKKGGKYKRDNPAVIYDAQSLALILRLRSGRHSREVAKSEFIFVTHNSMFSGRVKRFLRDQVLFPERSISPVLTVGQITIIGWLANEIVFEPGRISKELIANCYQASLPMDGWSQAFWERLNAADPETAEKITKDALLVRGVQEAALRATHGRIEFLGKVNFAELMSEAREKTAKEVEEAKEIGRTEGISEAFSLASQKGRGRVDLLSDRVVKAIEFSIFIVCAICVFGSFFYVYESDTVVGISAAMIAGAVGVASVADLFGVKKFHYLRAFIKRPVKNVLLQVYKLFQ